MKILAVDKPQAGLTMDKIMPHLKAETLHLWQSYTSGAVREMYTRQDRPGAILVLECADVEEARRVLHEFPLVKAGLLDFELIPLAPFKGIEALFAKE